MITPTPEYHVLNDAILQAAQELAHRSPTSRKIIFIISDGQEYGSRASYAQVLKVLLTDGIAVYGIGVDTAAMPVYNKVAKARIPGFGYSNILPKYANATGGDVLDEFSRESIESAYSRITVEATQSVHPGLQHRPAAVEQLSRHRSAGEAARARSHCQARILSAAAAARNAAAPGGDSGRPGHNPATAARELALGSWHLSYSAKNKYLRDKIQKRGSYAALLYC